MNKETPAERHERMVTFGVDRYRETFIKVWVREAAGGRIPGVAQMSEEEMLDFFRSAPPEFFQQLALRNPEQALRMLRVFERGEQKAGFAG